MADFLDQATYVLEFLIHKGTDIDTQNVKPYWIYRAIIADGSGKEYCRALTCGQRDPIWNHSQTELYLCPPKFLYLDVIEENCYGDPSPSTGAVVRGSAQIELPRPGFKETRKVELVRPDGFEKTFGGFVYISLGMRKLPLWKVLENANAIAGIRVPKLTGFLLANAEALGLSSSKLSTILLTNADDLSLVKLAERVFANAKLLSSSPPANRKRRNQHVRAVGFPNGRNW